MRAQPQAPQPWLPEGLTSPTKGHAWRQGLIPSYSHREATPAPELPVAHPLSQSLLPGPRVAQQSLCCVLCPSAFLTKPFPITATQGRVGARALRELVGEAEVEPSSYSGEVGPRGGQGCGHPGKASQRRRGSAPSGSQKATASSGHLGWAKAQVPAILGRDMMEGRISSPFHILPLNTQLLRAHAGPLRTSWDVFGGLKPLNTTLGADTPVLRDPGQMKPAVGTGRQGQVERLGLCPGAPHSPGHTGSMRFPTGKGICITSLPSTAQKGRSGPGLFKDNPGQGPGSQAPQHRTKHRQKGPSGERPMPAQCAALGWALRGELRGSDLCHEPKNAMNPCIILANLMYHECLFCKTNP